MTPEQTPLHSHPVLLAPVRIETRFIKTISGDVDLYIRIYPDRFTIDSHDNGLTPNEKEAGLRYRTAFNDGDKIKKRDAWRQLASSLGTRRAAYVSQIMLKNPDSMPEEKTVNWRNSPKLKGLPDHFEVFAYRGKEELALVHHMSLSKINDNLSILASPLNGLKDGLFYADSKWVKDFVEAETAGMAVKIRMTTDDLKDGFSRLLVVGLRSGSPDEGKKLLEELLDGHHFTDGFGFVPYDTPTNNTPESKSGYLATDSHSEGSFETEVLGSPLWNLPYNVNYPTNAQTLGAALGLGMKNEVLRYVENAGDYTDAYASHLQALLSPVLIEYMFPYILDRYLFSWDEVPGKGNRRFIEFLKQEFDISWVKTAKIEKIDNGIIVTDITDKEKYISLGLNNEKTKVNLKIDDGRSAELVAISEYSKLNIYLNGFSEPQDLGNIVGEFFYFARARGPLPTIRIGNQPYGVLPVSSIWFKEDKRPFGWELTEFDSSSQFTFHCILTRLFETWLHCTSKKELVPRVTRDGDPDDELLQILSMQPTSISYQVRPFSNDRKWLQLKSYYANSILEDLIEQWKIKQTDAFTDPIPATVGSNPYDIPEKYLSALIDELESRGSAVTSQTLLCDMIRRAQKLDTSTTTHLYMLFESPIDYREQSSGLRDLYRPNYDSLFRQALDLCTHRLDAWLTACAYRRLEVMRDSTSEKIYFGGHHIKGFKEGQTMRQSAPEGIYFGAYCWVEDLVPSSSSTLSEGYIHAPSTGHAATAAVLHNAFLTHKDRNASSQDGNSYCVNLHSDRVRRALRVMEGIRQGQGLGALLGFQFERSLPDHLRRYIDDFRKAFPTVSKRGGAESIPVETISARNVVDGAALARRWQQLRDESSNSRPSVNTMFVNCDPPIQITEHDAALAVVLDWLLDSLDAVGDVLLTEGVYHTVQGNYERGGAALDSASGNAPPPDIRSMETPISGTNLGHRVCILFPENFDTAVNKQSFGPRGQAEPRIATWFSELLGLLEEIGCTARYDSLEALNQADVNELVSQVGLSEGTAQRLVDERSAKGIFWTLSSISERVPDLSGSDIEAIKKLITEETVTLSLADLGASDTDPKRIDAADLLYLAYSPPVGNDTEIEQRIVEYVRRLRGLPKNVRVVVQAQDMANFPRSVDDAFHLAYQALNTLGGHSYCGPDALCPPVFAHEAIFTEDDIKELEQRVLKAEEAASSVLSRLSGELAADGSNHASVMSALFEANRFGVPAGIPGVNPDTTLEVLRSNAEKELTRRIEECMQLQARVKYARDHPEQKIATSAEMISLLVDAMRALFGKSFIVLPTFAAYEPGGFDKAFADQSVLAGLGEERIRLWLQQVAQIHPSLQQLDDLLMLAESWQQTSMDSVSPSCSLKVAQMPYRSDVKWLALDDIERGGEPENEKNIRGTLSLVAALGGTPDQSGSHKYAGIMLEHWDELLPSRTVTTSVSFHYNAPNTQAPQCLLLAVPPQDPDSTAKWSTEELAQIVNDSFDLAKARAVDFDALDQSDDWGRLPSILLPVNLGGIQISEIFHQDIPKDAEMRFKEHLAQIFDARWILLAEIFKFDNGRTIRLTDGINSLSLKLNLKQTNVVLKINDVRTKKFITRIENGMINIYKKKR